MLRHKNRKFLSSGKIEEANGYADRGFAARKVDAAVSQRPHSAVTIRTVIKNRNFFATG
jgi:hypothetical protein